MNHGRKITPRELRTLQEKAHLPEVQEIIRAEIFNGTIRVRPAPGGGIIITPTQGHFAVDHRRGMVREDSEPNAPRGSLLHPIEPVHPSTHGVIA
jgi:hypothetical protein